MTTAPWAYSSLHATSTQRKGLRQSFQRTALLRRRTRCPTGSSRTSALSKIRHTGRPGGNATSEDFIFYFFVLQKLLRANSLQSQTKMKILNNHEIGIAERLLQKHIPKSLKVYGHLFTMNRTQESMPTLEISVDVWPDFNVIVCRPQTKNKNAPDYTKWVSFFCMDDQMLSNMLKEDDIVDWSAYCKLRGIDKSYNPLLKEISSQRGTSFRCLSQVHLLHLTDFDSLLSPEHSEVPFRVSSLNDSHVELVNTTWKFGGDENGCRTIKKMIGNFPSCCIIDDHGQPVSWILAYDYGAMGILYTLPAHRGKGYAKALVSCMARKLHAQGFPVYCFVEEENTVSYRLFKNLGFIEDPSYRAAWWECNF